MQKAIWKCILLVVRFYYAGRCHVCYEAECRWQSGRNGSLILTMINEQRQKMNYIGLWEARNIFVKILTHLPVLFSANYFQKFYMLSTVDCIFHYCLFLFLSTFVLLGIHNFKNTNTFLITQRKCMSQCDCAIDAGHKSPVL